MKQTCLLLSAVLLLGVPSSFEECAIETIHGVPTYVCNSVQELEEQGNSNLFDVSIYQNKPDDTQKSPNLQIILVEDSNTTGVSSNTIQLLKELSKIFTRNNEVGTLPAGIFTNLPLQDLSLHKNGITNIAPGAFSTLTGLQRLQIVENKLSIVKNEVFNNLPVQLLALSKNRISFIERDAFKGMSRLKYLHLDGNRLSEFQPEITMSHPQQLEELYLEHNSFTEVDRNTVRGLNNLKVLDLNSNKISQCSTYTFDDLQQLEILNLGNNLLLDLKAEVFPASGMPKLTKLYLHRNRLSYLTTTVLERLRNLEHIRIGGNPWQCPCLDAILAWLNDHEVQRNCDKDYFTGTRPVCIVPEAHPNRCENVNDLSYYKNYSEIDNRASTTPECVL